MEKINLGNSPDLTMGDLMKQLFNNRYLSDIQFLVEDKILFAHSFELMKRSIVFRQQFSGTLGDNKLITIGDTPYIIFHQFLHFIYTDECNIGPGMLCEMLKLAVKYKIVTLENKLLNMGKTFSTELKLFEFCLVNKYELYLNNVHDKIIRYLNHVVNTETFLQLKPNILAKIFNSAHMPTGMTETKLFNHLICWMNRFCEIHQIAKSQRRAHFDELIRLIRFPLMSSEEFNLCVANHSDLFASNEVSAICTQIVLKGKFAENTKWSAEPRLEYDVPWLMENHTAPNRKCLAKFRVLENLILAGLRFGSGFSDVIIEISGKPQSTNNAAPESLTFNFAAARTQFNTISLGETIKLKPTIDYCIEHRYKNPILDVICCRPNVNCFVTGPSGLITFTEMSENLFEIIFKLTVN